MKTPESGPDENLWFIEEIYRYDDELKSWIERRFPVITDIEDLVQEAYTKLMKARRSGPLANPKAYLFITCRNLALNRIRHFKFETPNIHSEADSFLLLDGELNPLEQATQSEEINHLKTAIQSLPNRCRQVMTLRKIYGFTQKETAAYLGISENTVETQSQIGLKKCITYFKKSGLLPDRLR